MLLRRDAPDPLYVQIKEYLTSEIKAGRFQPDQRLPSERELSQELHVGRMTVRQALLELMREGAVYTRTGKGTFVQGSKIDQDLRSVTGFSQDVRARGEHPSSRVIEAKVVMAPLSAAHALRLAPEEKLILLARLRFSDGIPLAREAAYLPFSRFSNLLAHDFTVESLYEVLKADYGIILVQAEQTMEAALASPAEIELLSLQPPAAVLRIERLTYAYDGLPVEYVLSTYRGDRYKFRSILQTGTFL
jgi:GntR family transcriptional regulator